MQGQGQAIAVAGGQAFGVAYLLDGATHNNPYDNLNLPFPFPDALQEFRLETSTTNANNGMIRQIIDRMNTCIWSGPIRLFPSNSPMLIVLAAWPGLFITRSSIDAAGSREQTGRLAWSTQQDPAYGGISDFVNPDPRSILAC